MFFSVWPSETEFIKKISFLDHRVKPWIFFLQNPRFVLLFTETGKFFRLLDFFHLDIRTRWQVWILDFLRDFCLLCKESIDVINENLNKQWVFYKDFIGRSAGRWGLALFTFYIVWILLMLQNTVGSFFFIHLSVVCAWAEQNLVLFCKLPNRNFLWSSLQYFYLFQNDRVRFLIPGHLHCSFLTKHLHCGGASQGKPPVPI